MSQMRKLKYHEQKLLKKTNFLEWKSDNTAREAAILHRYHINRREDYQYYNRLVGKIQSFTKKLSELPPNDELRIQLTEQLMRKLYNMGLMPLENSLAGVEKINASSFCKRRLPVVMVRLHMANNLEQANNLVKQGHVRVGVDLISDPAFLVTREMEDYVTWVDTSKIKQHIMKYNDKLDDFDLLGEYVCLLEKGCGSVLRVLCIKSRGVGQCVLSLWWCVKFVLYSLLEGDNGECL